MEGVIEEGAEALEEDVFDLGIIAAGSRIEYYEMAGYMVSLLRQPFAEEEGPEEKAETAPVEERSN